MEWSNVPTTNGWPVNEPFVTGRSACHGAARLARQRTVVGRSSFKTHIMDTTRAVFRKV